MLTPALLQDENKHSEEDDERLDAVHNDGEPGAAVALARIGQGEAVEQGGRDSPWCVQVVGGEGDAVDEPSFAAEAAFHSWEEVAAEEELFAEHGVEDEKSD